MLAIIGGSGLTQLGILHADTREIVRTPYGEPSGPLTRGRIAGRHVIFLARHGYGHTYAPHEVNYRANLWALHSQGAKDIVTVNTVGAIASTLKPGDIIVPHQIIDYTHGRASTFFEGEGQPVRHVDFTEPFDARLRTLCLDAARAMDEAVIDGGVIGCTQGPRLETAAEIDKLDRDGATLVGMTSMPEAVLARELEMGYATLAVAVNHAAGRGSSKRLIAFADLETTLHAGMARASKIVEKIVERYNYS